MIARRFAVGIDNNNYYDGDTLGNALRLRRVDNRTGSDDDGALTIRTVILVQNSMRGGGTPVLGKYAGETGVTRKTGNPATALWNQDAPEALKNAAVYVNGSRVENPLGNSGFGGRSEVLSIETAGDYSVSAFGFYGNSENAALGEMFGEILLYSKVLATAQREDIEAYLQRKYLGTIKSGYCALRSLDVNGADKVRVPDFSTLPRVSAGEVTVNGEVLNFTVVGGASSQVVNGVDLGKSSLLLPSAKTVAVRFNGKPSYGVYTLVSAGSISVGDLELETAGKTGTARFELRRSSSAIQLAVMAGGMMMKIR